MRPVDQDRPTKMGKVREDIVDPAVNSTPCICLVNHYNDPVHMEVPAAGTFKALPLTHGLSTLRSCTLY